MSYGKTKQARQSLYVDESFKQMLEKRAKNSKRSVNREVIYMLELFLKQEQAAQKGAMVNLG